MTNEFNLESQEDVLDQIIFEIICLSQELPEEDIDVSLTTLFELVEFDTLTTMMLTPACKTLIVAKDYDGFKHMFAEALVLNEMERLAEQLNARANKLMN